MMASKSFTSPRSNMANRMSTEDPTLSSTLPLIDLSPYLSPNGSSSDESPCVALANALRDYGAVLVQDPRVTPNDADAFLNQMERYFAQPDEDKMKDVRAEQGYQIGATPAGIEHARDNSEEIAKLKKQERPKGKVKANDMFGMGDPKWRFFWQISEEGDPIANEEQVVPKGFGEWAEVMNTWGCKLMASLCVVVRMLERGLGLERGSIWNKFKGGKHLLAPTGCDMKRYGNEETIGVAIARFHYDLNALSIHGKCRYPGLHIWTTRQQRRLKCAVPTGCLLVQAGVQIEHLTGGVIRRGFHEVVVSEDTLAATKKARERNEVLWRVSSTLFGHVRSDASLLPLMGNRDADKYPDIKAKDQVAAELRAINLAT